MNVYTRREEMRWTIVALTVLVLSFGGAVVRLVTAEGRLIPDPAAIATAKAADTKAQQAKACQTAADRLNTEIPVFKASAKAARLAATATPSATPPPVKGKKPPPPKEKEPDVDLAWPSALPSYKQVKLLAPCRPLVDGVTGAKPEAAKGWDAVVAAAAVTPGEDYKSQVEAARKLLAALGEAPVDKVLEATKEAESALKKAADAEQEKAKTAQVREPLPKGLLPRELAVGLGVLIGVLTLLASFLSVRAAASRRLSTLLPLREAAKTGNSGMQAAALLTLASQHNGGEPGLVIGAGVGGLIAAIVFPLDADIFVAGVMVGLLLGLGFQWTVRMFEGLSNWRRRATELADIEKPAVPIVLVLSTVHLGREPEFWAFFSKLSAQEQAATVAQLASQAEEQILAAADAGAAQPYPQQAMQQGYPGGGMPPGGGFPPGGMPPGGGFPPGGGYPGR
ncbi:hypothetical protein [Polyangium sp. y55x31]|uniref:hypothetical protein n=1 Tax=Polyangium sp. y55x31 TaxID=3042688 RepID=UPI0024825677|nr:hypothetical protein [Polyangium sp. y55x31]MDI1475807.1 hypothetical protein [Polyangium sp. y55x31]